MNAMIQPQALDITSIPVLIDQTYKDAANLQLDSSVVVQDTFGFLFSYEESGQQVKLKWSAFSPNALAPSEHIADYRFDKELVKKIHYCHREREPLLLIGDTETGKTSHVEQVAQRLNWPVLRVQCHPNMEYSSLFGFLQLNENGTFWVDGPATLAYRYGLVLILEERHLIPDDLSAALNTLLDRKPFVLEEKGSEIVHPHHNFWVVATANQLGLGDGRRSYNGQKQDISSNRRFIIEHVNYMPEAERIAMLRSVADPTIFDDMAINKIVNLSQALIDDFRSGMLPMPIGISKLVKMVKIIDVFEDYSSAFDSVYLNGIPRESDAYTHAINLFETEIDKYVYRTGEEPKQLNPATGR